MHVDDHTALTQSSEPMPWVSSDHKIDSCGGYTSIANISKSDSSFEQKLLVSL